jgi:short subunit dehydrogenase-like uncharacterized protein
MSARTYDLVLFGATGYTGGLTAEYLARNVPASTRRALAIDEQSFGGKHPEVARDLNNLATLLQDTNRLAEAEPLMRRALAVFIDSLGPEHPNSYTVAENYVSLLQAMGKTEDEINDILVAVLRGA